MKVLMIAHTFPPFGTVGGSIRLVKYLKFMSQAGSKWAATVITIRDDIDLLYVGKKSSFSIEEIPDETRIIRTETSEFKAPVFINDTVSHFIRKVYLLLTRPFYSYLLVPDDRILWYKHLRAAIQDEIGSGEYDVIYVTAPPFSVLHTAAKISKETNLPLVLDIKDDWLDEERFKPFLKKWRWAIEKKMEARAVEAASRVILVTQKSQAAYQERYPDQSGKFTYIPNGCDVDEYRGYWLSPPAKYKKFTLVHAGVFSSRRNLGSLFQAIKQFISESDEIRNNLVFKIIGRVPVDQMRLIEQIGISDYVEISDYLSRTEYIETLFCSHLPVAINYEIATLIPGKLYEYWGSRNSALLLDGESSAACDLVKKYKLGYVVNPEDVDGILDVLRIKWKQYMSGECELVSERGIEKFDRKHLAQQLQYVLDDVCVNSNNG